MTNQKHSPAPAVSAEPRTSNLEAFLAAEVECEVFEKQVLPALRRYGKQIAYPVGFVRRYAIEFLRKPGQTVINHEPQADDDIALYLHPDPKVARAQQVPEGWQLVPKEANVKMRIAGGGAMGDSSRRRATVPQTLDAIYCAMLSSAPKPSEPEHAPCYYDTDRNR